ncbi:MAG TPA: YbhB/YbcL family Raf kinase inhibitor-like protein [Candidatus Yonathbacteria bacterium]|nr:YbhB/YbcL family Raf kinase inhibitor-like protein [Candidatus Yonathbacteria bacterium]
MPLTISSPAFKMNGLIPAIFTCDGRNISPKLIFSNIPVGTQSLSLTMEDPDVPKNIRTDGMWNHWVVWNIPPETIQIEEGKIPPGVIGAGTNKKASYLGPCPPDREHRYIFTLYALDSVLSLSPGSTKEELLHALAPHIIEKAVLIGTYNRN